MLINRKRRIFLAGALLVVLVLAISFAGPRRTEGTVAAAVQVVNPYVPVEVENSSRTEFEYTALLSPGSFATANPVPAGKRLNVDFVSGVCSLEAGSAGVGVAVVRNHPFSDSGRIFVPVSLGNNLYAFSQQTRIYVEPGQSVTVTTGFHGNMDCNIGVFGFFVNE